MSEEQEPVRPFERLGTEAGPDLKILQVRYEQLRNPRNQREMRGLILDSNDWVNLVATTADGSLLMIEQYRIGVDDITLETPGGSVDPGEDHEQAARRELLEETGYGGGRWRYLGAVEPNPAIHPHLCHHWLAEDIEVVAAQDLGEGEDIRIRLMSVQEVADAVRSGVIRHALALSALSRVYDFWGNQFHIDS